MTETPIRDAATIILTRPSANGAEVLMGQRGKRAVFMPGKFVFPGGAVDPEDFMPKAPPALGPVCRRRLSVDVAQPEIAPALVQAAARELREETGLELAQVAALRFFFRAITPPGPPRRFDARFFVAPAAAISGNLDDFSAAEDELSHLQWLPTADARQLDLPFVTRIVLAELEHYTPGTTPAQVPFYDHREMLGEIRTLD